jgi:hypothetical protein
MRKKKPAAGIARSEPNVGHVGAVLERIANCCFVGVQILHGSAFLDPGCGVV